MTVMAAAALAPAGAARAAGAAGDGSGNGQDTRFQIASNMEIMYDIVRELDLLYVDTLDMKKTIETGISAMLGSIDPYTEYYSADDMNELKTMTTGKYGGIGAVIRQYPKRDYVYISEPYEGMPAQKAGLKAGDSILAIDGESMKGKASQYVSEHLRGDVGTALTVTVGRGDDSLDVRFERSTITLPAVPYYGLLDGYGYIMLEQFTEKCSRQVLKAVVDLKSQGAKGLILDLRGNGGGLLNEAVDIVGLFVPLGTKVVEIKGKTPQARASYVTQKKPVDTEIPLVVLIDGESASASEIVSGCLQDLDRAVVLGARSYGKGLVQSTRPMPYNGTVKLTTARYYIPSGRCIQELDYSKRNDRGQAQHIPDSLTTVFHTAAGRPVRDGGGIRPDVECPVDTLPDLVYALSQNVLMFDFVNGFCRAHERIAPAGEFAVSDSVLDDFKEFCRNGGFEYASASSKALKSLRAVARSEGLESGALDEFKALEKKLAYDREAGLDQYDEVIRRVLAVDIVCRYYYQKGAVIQSLKDDNVAKQAVGLLSDAERYRGILMPSRLPSE